MFDFRHCMSVPGRGETDSTRAFILIKISEFLINRIALPDKFPVYLEKTS